LSTLRATSFTATRPPKRIVTESSLRSCIAKFP
jgi:hypothetical protein